LNGGRYCNPALDATLNTARQSVEPATRATAYDAAARIYLADRPYIYLWHSRVLHGVGAGVQGLQAVPDGIIRVQGLRGARG
jgi:peptide/nickel transport system substrate-binding protein